VIAAYVIAALAQTVAPQPSPAASPRATGFQLAATFVTTFLDQNTSGPGKVGPEVPGYLKGGPLAPNTPYDGFSTAPLTPGSRHHRCAGDGDRAHEDARHRPERRLGLRRRQHHQRVVLGREPHADDQPAVTAGRHDCSSGERCGRTRRDVALKPARNLPTSLEDPCNYEWSRLSW
jgi:hypothetical protein